MTNKKPLNSSERYEAKMPLRWNQEQWTYSYIQDSENSLRTLQRLTLKCYSFYDECNNATPNATTWTIEAMLSAKWTNHTWNERRFWKSSLTRQMPRHERQRILLQNCSCYNANSGWLMNDLAQRILQQNCSCYKQIWMKDSVYVSRHKRKTSTRLSRRITQHNRWLWNTIMLYLIEKYSMETRTSTKRNVLFCSPLASVQRRNNFDGYWRCWICFLSF